MTIIYNCIISDCILKCFTGEVISWGIVKANESVLNTKQNLANIPMTSFWSAEDREYMKGLSCL
jgi:hypothetical protein